MPADLLSWKSGSSIRAVASGSAQVRQYHPAIWIMDEAAFLPEAAASYDAAEPVSSQIFVISTAGPSWFGDICQSIMENCPPCTA
jgi:hypothetical protein